MYYRELPQNKDLTMILASLAGFEVPLHGMIYSADKSLSYFIKRFDRSAKNRKIAVEDFAQLAGKNRNTKYNYSMERAADIIEAILYIPGIRKNKVF